MFSPPRKNATPGIVQARNLKLAWLVHGFGTRHAAGDALARTLSGGRKPWPVLTLRQVHSDIIHSIAAAPAEGTAPPAGDGMITRQRRLLLAVRTADCLPVILADPGHRAVGIFHAGWRGTLARLVEKGVGRMRAEFGSRPARLRAALGPCIHACCYQVGPEVRDLFASQFEYAGELFREVLSLDAVRAKYPLLFMSARPPGHTEPESRLHLDLVAANRRQLLDAGLPAKNIEASELCTACRPDLLHSYRREKEKAGRMVAMVGVRG